MRRVIAKKRGKAVEEVYQEIKRMLYFNLLAPGQRLVYHDLAKKLNVSITPIVQALIRLQRSNLVRYEPNKGYFVGEITEGEAKELYQAREALELYAVPLIVKNLTTEKILIPAIVISHKLRWEMEKFMLFGRIKITLTMQVLKMIFIIGLKK